MLSGGDVYVPVGTTADALTTQDGEVQDGQYSRQYLFGGTAVGTSVMVATQEEDTSLVDASVQNIDAAKNYTEVVTIFHTLSLAVLESCFFS